MRAPYKTRPLSCIRSAVANTLIPTLYYRVFVRGRAPPVIWQQYKSVCVCERVHLYIRVYLAGIFMLAISQGRGCATLYSGEIIYGLNGLIYAIFYSNVIGDSRRCCCCRAFFLLVRGIRRYSI